MCFLVSPRLVERSQLFDGIDKIGQWGIEFVLLR